MTPRKTILILFVALAVAVIPAVAFSATTTVKARASSWGPARPTIERGDTIKWTNQDGSFRDHTVRSYGRNWSMNEMLPVGDTVTRRFREVGRYKFKCLLHSTMVDGVCEGMCGVIKVVRPG